MASKAEKETRDRIEHVTFDLEKTEEKLHEFLDRLETRLDQLRTSTRDNDLKIAIRNIEGEIESLKENLEQAIELSNEIEDYESDIDTVKQNDEVDASRLENDLEQIESDLTSLESFFSNKFIPRVSDLDQLFLSCMKATNYYTQNGEIDPSRGKDTSGAEEMKTFVSRLEQSSQKKEIIENLQSDLEKTKTLLERLERIELKEESGKTARQNWETDGKEWREILDNPNKHIDAGFELANYSPQKWFSYPLMNDVKGANLHQGFKIHISAYPSEGWRVARELIPVLQKMGVEHKVMHSQNFHRQKINSRGSESLQIRKFMTIYPSCSQSSQSFIEGGDYSRNQKNMYPNESETVNIIQRIVNNVNAKTLNGGPDVQGERRKHGRKFTAGETRVGNTRIHLRYDLISPDLDSINIKRHGPKSQAINDYISDPEAYRDGFLGYYFDNPPTDIKEKVMAGRSRPLFGKDGKIAGTYYLPPPESWNRINQIISRAI
jgi:hypothetical protein